MSTVRERIEEVRYIYHISQAELARRIGVTSQNISQIVNGKIQLSYLTAKAIESEFGVNAEWLLNGTGEMRTVKDNKAKELNLVPELISALKAYPGIADALNGIATRMTLADWAALNDFCTRQKEPDSE